MKRMISATAVLMMVAAIFAGCNTNTPAVTQTGTPASPPASTAASQPVTTGFDTAREISVVSREDGSGTRGAFIELFEVETEGADGSVSDGTTEEAIIADRTDVMLTNIAGDPYAIGYVSLGSLNSTVKAVNIDGVQATVENIINGTYKAQRPFNIAVRGDATGLAADFIDYILSSEGQAVITANNYIAIDANAPAFAGGSETGRIVVGGSSSVTPVMEVLREEYLAINPDAEIEIQMSDSSAGMSSTIAGSFDIGMASRDLKESELAELTPMVIAIDGIAVIINNENSIADISSEQVKSVFMGESLLWSDVA